MLFSTLTLEWYCITFNPMDIDTKIIEYIDVHEQEFLDNLKKIIHIPTIGAQKEHDDAKTCVNFLSTLLHQAGIDDVKILDQYARPLLFAQKILNPNYKTILLYAHYDVQPAEPLELWNTDPFTLTVKDDKMYGRGVSDDKGSVIMLIKAVESLIKTQNLRCNVKFIFEGGEETGSTDFIDFLQNKENLEILKNDLTLVCDCSIFDKNKPLICIGTRGIVCMELRVIGANRDVHSGLFGGVVGNPIHAISSIINSFHDDDNKVAIEGFYDNVETISQRDHDICEKVNFDDGVKKELGVSDFVKEKDLLEVECTGLRPTIEVNGIEGGYCAEGFKTIIPSFAKAKISCRLVSEQDPMSTFYCVKKHIEKHLPQGFSFELDLIDGGGKAFKVDVDTEDFKNYCTAFAQEYDRAPLPSFDGGSIGVVSYMKECLNKNILLCGFSENDSLIHSPNENLRVENFFKGIKVLSRFLYCAK